MFHTVIYAIETLNRKYKGRERAIRSDNDPRLIEVYRIGNSDAISQCVGNWTSEVQAFSVGCKLDRRMKSNKIIRK